MHVPKDPGVDDVLSPNGNIEHSPCLEDAMPTDTWPQPPCHPKDLPALLELLGPDEFERHGSLDVARAQWTEWHHGVTEYLQSESHPQTRL